MTLCTPSRSLQAVIHGECQRQHVGRDRELMLGEAYCQAKDLVEASGGKLVPTVALIESLAGLLEPDSLGHLRTTEVTFSSGGSAAPASTVRGALERWCTFLAEEEAFPLEPSLADEYVRSFESIHPFADGNGRTAWLLRVWLTGTWEAPQALPHYQHY